jgi:hypothetical protein
MFIPTNSNSFLYLQFQTQTQEVAADVQRNFSYVGSQVASFSQSIVTGTGEILNQVRFVSLY